MLDKLTTFTGAADHIDAIARVGMLSMPVVGLVVLTALRIGLLV